MIDKDPKIRKGMPATRNPACLRTISDIVIPAGTLFRNAGGDSYLTLVGIGSPDNHAEVTIDLKPHDPLPTMIQRVVAP